jgi:radical SAM-linked protein
LEVYIKLNVIRCIYTREDKVKYISHLDLLRVFERALRRAGLPVQFSEGFNPRPKIVIALPLPVGVTSEGEYADFSVDGQITADSFMLLLNTELPDGIRIIDAWEHNPKSNVMAEVESALYELTAIFEGAADDEVEKALEKAGKNVEVIMKKNEVKVQKRSDKGTKEVDIRPLIKDITIIEPDDIRRNTINNGNNVLMLKIAATVSAGSRNNLRPDLLAQALRNASCGSIKVLGIHRVKLLLNENI